MTQQWDETIGSLADGSVDRLLPAALRAARFKTRLTSAQITELLGIIRDGPKPLLVHCKSGADRAGLVLALYLFADEGVSAPTPTNNCLWSMAISLT